MGFVLLPAILNLGLDHARVAWPHEWGEPTDTPNNVCSVTYYLELRNAIAIYCTPNSLPIKVKLVVWA
jgi:hypothetical protein